MKREKIWCILLMCVSVIILIVLAVPTILIDPYFHYHGPLEQYEYPLNKDEQRYLNDGIIRHFDYDALMIGSSMTENFKTSQLDELFDVNSVKVCYLGDTFYQMRMNIEKAIEEKDELKMVVTSLDITRLTDSSTHLRNDLGDYPTYLYDNNYFNDVGYLLNKEVLLEKTYGIIKYTKEGNVSTTFDEYCNEAKLMEYSRDAVLYSYDRIEPREADVEGQEAQQANVSDNITENIVALAQANPDVKFYLFFPPYSICYWDELDRYGALEWQIDNMQIATELILECDNIYLYSFYDEHEMVCNLDNYKDIAHYSEEINEQILEWMANGEYRLTKENYEEHFTNMKEYYGNYDYDSIFE